MKYMWQRIVAISAVLGALSAQAQVPEMVNYQGRVVTDGTNYHGIGQFKFALIDEGTDVARQSTATANLTGQFVTSATVTDGGSGYSTPPAVSFSGGGGSGATAHALISAGVVTSIVVDSAGTGYITPPVVLIDAPPVSMEYTTYWSNDETPSGEPTNAVSLTVTRGLFSVLLGNTSIANMATLPADVFASESVYLRVWFSDGGPFEQLTPDQRLASVPYAMKAAGGLPNNVLVVGEGGQYESITNALNAITDNSSERPYLIKVGPGIYAEHVVMKSYVEIEGSGELATIISGGGVTNLNSDGTVVAADQSAIRNLSIVTSNSVVESGNYSTSLFIGSSITNFTARNITCKAYGGYSARGVYCRYSSPVLKHITVEASGDKYSTGFSLYYSDAQLDNVSARVWGSAWYDKAIDLDNGSPRINNAFCHTLGDETGSWNHAVAMSGSSGTPYLNNVTALADATIGQNIGIKVNGPAAILTNCKITGEGSSENHGLYQFSSTVKIYNSLIEGSTSALHVSNGGSVTYAANCQIDGPRSTQFSGIITLFNCYDATFSAIP